MRDDAPATVYTVERNGPQHCFDLALSVHVGEQATFILSVDNLLDRQPPLAFGNAADAGASALRSPLGAELRTRARGAAGQLTSGLTAGRRARGGSLPRLM